MKNFYSMVIVAMGLFIWNVPLYAIDGGIIKVGESDTMKILTTCTDTEDNFYGTVSVTSYASSSTNVCIADVVSSAGDSYKLKFQEYSNSSSYSDSAINASLQTACAVVEQAQARGLEVRVSGDIEECSQGGRLKYNRISAEVVVYGDDDSDGENAFSGSTRGDAVSVSNATVPEYHVYSNQAHNHCSPYFASSVGDFEGLIYVSSSSSRGTGMTTLGTTLSASSNKSSLSLFSNADTYASAIARCNTLLNAAMDGSSVDITGTIYNAPGSSTIINADVTITAVE